MNDWRALDQPRASPEVEADSYQLGGGPHDLQMVRTKNWKALEAELYTPDEVSEAERWAKQEVLEMNLRELRSALGKTQEEVASAAEMTQSELSRAERRDDHLMSTLRRYVEALGGEIEVVARVRGKTVKLVGV